jgi:putative heme-binding domain-containing protein
MLIRVVVFAVTTLGAAIGLVAQQRTYLPAEIENGGRVYQANCAVCHGPEGDGVAGINFSTGRLRRAVSDDDLVRIIMGGIPGTAMPPSNFSDGQAGTIVAYLRSMAGGTASASSSRDAAAPSDPGRGRSIVEGKGQCLTCHAIAGTGARVGPNLTDIGAVRRASELERSLVEPDAEIRAENRPVRAVTKTGTAITGKLLNQDSFTLQVLDANERLVSIAKGDLREYSFLNTSPMPSYRDKLNGQERADVVSYLVLLKGRP